MRRIVTLMFIIILLSACGNMNATSNSVAEDKDDNVVKEQRKGFSPELQEDALEVANTIHELYIDKEITYNELDSESHEYKIIHNFHYDDYKNNDEEYSKQEDFLALKTILLISDYRDHKTETEEGTIRERGDDMIEKIHCIEKTVNEEGFYPC